MANFNSGTGPQTVLQWGVVSSSDKDSAQDHSSNQKVMSPFDHGTGVDNQHMAFSPMMIPPSADSQSIFNGIMAPGTPVLMMKTAGQSGGIILGQINTILNGGMGEGAGGGRDLLNVNPAIAKLRSTELDINTPPQIEETEEKGVKIRKIKERDQPFKLELLDGLPLHGALFNMSGFRLPEIKKVPTAKQKNTQMMTNQMMEQMVGQVMSLGQMFQSMMKKGSQGQKSQGGSVSGIGNGQSYMDDVLEKLSPAMQRAVTSLSNLIQGMETTGGVSFVTGGVVHEGIYLENAVSLLGQASNLDDVMYVLQRLQWDTSLMGHDELSTVENEIEDAWGVALQQVDIDGNITVTYANNQTSNVISSFANNFTDAASSPAAGYAPQNNQGSGGGGNQGLQNMFGQSAKIMQDMFKRLATVSEKESRKMTEKLNQDSGSQKTSEVVKKTIQGGNPVDPQNLDNQQSGFGVSFME